MPGPGMELIGEEEKRGLLEVIEAGYLSKYLVDRKIADENAVAWVFTVYGITVAISAWLSGALSDLWGPRKVMGLGLCIWTVFEVGFLLLGVAPGNYNHLMVMYALRGFGYPLFAYGFLVWISVAAPQDRLGTAVGWFWFSLTGGLMTLGPLFASYAMPAIGPYETLWCSLGLVAWCGGVGSAITTLMLYCAPHTFGVSYTLAGLALFLTLPGEKA